MKITKDISIEDLVNYKSESVSFLREKGIKCIACGEYLKRLQRIMD